MRVGFIGTGGNARGHIAQMSQLPEVEIVAFADPSARSLELAVERLGRPVPTFADHREMIARGGLDAVVISTPHTLHYEQTLFALEHGLHVEVEKPMACTSAHARHLVAKQRETGLVLAVGYQRHFQPRFRWVRDQIASGRIGAVTFLQCFQSQNWLRGHVGQWRLDPALSGGGQLNDSGSHLIDIVLWITGLEAAEASAYIDRRGADVDINSAVSLRFTNGAVGNVSIVGDQVAKGMWEDLTIAGERGIIWMRQGGAVHIATEDDLEPREVTDFGPSIGGKDKSPIDAILGRAEVQVPPSCGLGMIEATEAIWRFAEMGQPTTHSRTGRGGGPSADRPRVRRGPVPRGRLLAAGIRQGGTALAAVRRTHRRGSARSRGVHSQSPSPPRAGMGTGRRSAPRSSQAHRPGAQLPKARSSGVRSGGAASPVVGRQAVTTQTAMTAPRGRSAGEPRPAVRRAETNGSAPQRRRASGGNARLA